jgi:hypothetical protein
LRTPSFNACLIRRLVTSARTIAELREFVGDLLQTPPGGANLMQAYTRPSANTPSMVEELSAQLRHLTVHYSKVAKPELAKTLETYRHLPAEMTITAADDGSPDLEFRWARAIRSMEVLGNIRQDDFLAALRRDGQTTASLVGSWTWSLGSRSCFTDSGMCPAGGHRRSRPRRQSVPECATRLSSAGRPTILMRTYVRVYVIFNPASPDIALDAAESLEAIAIALAARTEPGLTVCVNSDGLTNALSETEQRELDDQLRALQR